MGRRPLHQQLPYWVPCGAIGVRHRSAGSSYSRSTHIGIGGVQRQQAACLIQAEVAALHVCMGVCSQGRAGGSSWLAEREEGVVVMVAVVYVYWCVSGRLS